MPTSYLTVVELNCGILCACLPTLRPLLRKLLPSLFPTSEDAPSNRPVGEGGLESGDSRKFKRSKHPNMYTLTEITNLGSAEALNENAATYEGSEYANYPGKATKLTTSIYGSRGRADQDRMDGYGSGQEIRVTTEIGMKESLKSSGSTSS